MIRLLVAASVIFAALFGRFAEIESRHNESAALSLAKELGRWPPDEEERAVIARHAKEAEAAALDASVCIVASLGSGLLAVVLGIRRVLIDASTARRLRRGRRRDRSASDDRESGSGRYGLLRCLTEDRHDPRYVSLEELGSDAESDPSDA